MAESYEATRARMKAALLAEGKNEFEAEALLRPFDAARPARTMAQVVADYMAAHPEYKAGF